jgi:hypothetical protein
MKVFGNPLGYVSNGALIGAVLGCFCVMRVGKFAIELKALGVLLCVVCGALLGYAAEKFVSRGKRE